MRWRSILAWLTTRFTTDVGLHHSLLSLVTPGVTAQQSQWRYCFHAAGSNTVAEFHRFNTDRLVWVCWHGLAVARWSRSTYCTVVTLREPFGTKVVHLGQRRIGEKRNWSFFVRSQEAAIYSKITTRHIINDKYSNSLLFTIRYDSRV